jgi:outer membrane protein assembly factor BamB
MKAADLVIIASNCRIIALQKKTGALAWEAVLNSSFFKMGETFVTVAFDDTGVYAHTINETFCLNLATGQVIWQQKLPSLGRGVASIALSTTSGADASAFAQIAARKRESSGGD